MRGQVWDLRKFKAPLHIWDDLPAAHPTTQVLPLTRLCMHNKLSSLRQTPPIRLWSQAQTLPNKRPGAAHCVLH
jgi:hypothetical protein